MKQTDPGKVIHDGDAETYRVWLSQISVDGPMVPIKFAFDFGIGVVRATLRQPGPNIVGTQEPPVKVHVRRFERAWRHDSAQIAALRADDATKSYPNIPTGVRRGICDRRPDSTDPVAEFSTLVEILRWRALQQPEQRIFTYLLDGEVEGDHLTHAALDERARSIGALLQSHRAAGSVHCCSIQRASSSSPLFLAASMPG